MEILFLKVGYLINKIQTVTFTNFKEAVSFHELFEKVVLRAFFYYYFFNKALETIPKVPRQKPKIV